MPDLLQFIALRARLEDLDGLPIININDVPLQGFNSLHQAGLDIAISSAARCVVAGDPAALIIALLIKRTSPGPVFYRQERMGLDGKAFTVYKFRSMYRDAEDDTGPVWAREDDPRATPIGRWLRRLDLDELPQFWNVLQGRHVDRRAAARAPVLRRAVQAPHPAVHAAAQGEGRHHRLGAGQRLARQHVAREAHRVRPLLHRELVGVARPQDHVADARGCSDGSPAQRSNATPCTHASALTSMRTRSSSPAPPASSDPISAEALLDRGHSVVGIDNLAHRRLANIAHLRDRDFRVHQHDVTNYIDVDGPVDFVLHWASPASPIDYLELPIQTLKVGSLGTHNALGLAKAKGARFVLASTSEVYGDPLEHPQKETYWGNVNPIGPRGVYDEAKRFAEAMTLAYHRYHGVDTKIVRIFNTYGPRMRVQRRPRGAGLHLAGAAQRGRDGLRRRHADAQLLLRHATSWTASSG